LCGCCIGIYDLDKGMFIVIYDDFDWFVMIIDVVGCMFVIIYDVFGCCISLCDISVIGLVWALWVYDLVGVKG